MAISDTNNKWTIGWGITARCDLNCPFCYSQEVRGSANTETCATVGESFLRQNASRIKAINFGTGESFLSPNFPQIIQLCSNILPGVPIAVTTNGAAVDLEKKQLSSIVECLSECDISLDFGDRDTFDRWRGKSGAWVRAMESLKLFSDTQVQTSLVLIGTAQTLTEENMNSLFEISERYGTAFRINFYMPTTGNMSFAPTRDQVYASLSLLLEWASSVRTSDRLFQSLLNQNGENGAKEVFSCRILPDGVYSPSTYLITKPWLTSFRITDRPLMALLDTEPFIRYRTPVIPEHCLSCVLLDSCQGGSIERRWLYCGTMDEPDPYCPHLDRGIGRLAADVVSDEWDGPEVHLGYLPTLIAKGPSK